MQDAPGFHPKGSYAMDITRQEEERQAKRDVETINRKGDERQRLDMELTRSLVPGQAVLDNFGDGLMCTPSRRGLDR